MELSLFAKIQWAIAALLELAVLLLALRRRLFKSHPLFTAYLCLLVVNEISMWLIYIIAGIQSRSEFYAYWMFQSLLLLLRGAAVYEICRVMLADLVGVWRLCRGSLLFLSSILALTAILAAIRSGPRASVIVPTADRGLELAVVGVLLFGLAFCRYYHIEIPGYVAWMALGLGFYSAVQVTNNTIFRQYQVSYFPVWNEIKILSFNITTVLWGIALWKPLPVLRLAPATLPPGAYEVIAPHITSRLRSLNARLLELWK